MHATQAPTTHVQSSPEPFPRPDHKAKKHGRPKPRAHYRRAVRRQCEKAIERALFGGVV